MVASWINWLFDVWELWYQLFAGLLLLCALGLFVPLAQALVAWVGLDREG